MIEAGKHVVTYFVKEGDEIVKYVEVFSDRNDALVRKAELKLCDNVISASVHKVRRSTEA